MPEINLKATPYLCYTTLNHSFAFKFNAFMGLMAHNWFLIKVRKCIRYNRLFYHFKLV